VPCAEWIDHEVADIATQTQRSIIDLDTPSHLNYV